MGEEISFKNLLPTSGFFDGFQRSISREQAVRLLRHKCDVNEEDAHRDVLVLVKETLQHVPAVNTWGGE